MRESMLGLEDYASRYSPQRRAARHSARVRKLKILLPVVAILVVLAGIGLIAWRSLSPVGFLISGAGIQDGNITINAPELSGFDDQNQAYRVKAAKAYQSLDDPDQVTLEEIDARIEMKNDQWAQLTAETGVFDTEARKLDLTKGIKARSSEGYQVQLSQAKVDLAEGHLTTDEPVAIEGPNLHLKAQKAEVVDKGRTLRFSGGVSLILNSVTPEAD